MPVAARGRMILGAGVSADGILSAKAASIWVRKAEAEDIFYSPYLRLLKPRIQPSLVAISVQQQPQIIANEDVIFLEKIAEQRDSCSQLVRGTA
jgi:hypothetical protein